MENIERRRNLKIKKTMDKTEKPVVMSRKDKQKKNPCIWVCAKCDSTDVEVTVWMGINSYQYTYDIDPPDYFCNKCNDYTNIKTKRNG